MDAALLSGKPVEVRFDSEKNRLLFSVCARYGFDLKKHQAKEALIPCTLNAPAEWIKSLMLNRRLSFIEFQAHLEFNENQIVVVCHQRTINYILQ